MTDLTATSQAALDSRNAHFWDELCGSALARSLGIEDASESELARFDRAYMDFYPYLATALPARLDSHEVLEVGLGFGTLAASWSEGSLLPRSRHRGGTGRDGSRAPSASRPSGCRRAGAARIRAGGPHLMGRSDRVYSIGCLHHTGDLQAVHELPLAAAGRHSRGDALQPPFAPPTGEGSAARRCWAPPWQRRGDRALRRERRR